jgi:hypothetical protein
MKETQELVGALHVADPSIVATILYPVAKPSEKHDTR